MNEKLKERVLKLEQILLGLQEESKDPLVTNRLDEAIHFIASVSEEVCKTQTFLEHLINELEKQDIVSHERINNLKVISDIDFEIQTLKTRLADIIRRENELEECGIPDLKEKTQKAKESLCLRIETLEQELKEARAYESTHSENAVCSGKILPPQISS